MDSSDAQRVHAPQFREFFLNWAKDPLTIGAVAPSGRTLAKLMVSGLHPGARVLELGAGTGTVTRAILDSGVEQHDLYLVERNASFAQLLQQRFPRAVLIEKDATTLADERPELAGSMDFVVSGLPLVLFQRAQRLSLLRSSFELLKPAGQFLQFTYAGRCPVRRSQLDALGLAASLVGIAPFNVPPAFVYRIRRGA